MNYARLLLALAFAAVVAVAAPARAQSVWPTPDGGQETGTVQTCLNASGHAVPVSSGQCANGEQPKSFVSAGSQQNALAVGTNTQLTVPAGALCAEITVEGASIRRTSDTTSASATNGTLIPQGAQWQDCGPLAAYKFSAVSGSPTLDVEYFK
jgi:hypothetical protein